MQTNTKSKTTHTNNTTTIKHVNTSRTNTCNNTKQYKQTYKRTHIHENTKIQTCNTHDKLQHNN